MTPPQVTVVGSINLDHVITAAALPAPGETVTGGSFARHPGGKGANQAVAAARCGAEVRMIGAVGDDADGRAALDALRGEGVDVDGVQVVDAPTGVALIVVDGDGRNQIAVASGANDQVMVPSGWDPGEGVVVTGFEVPDDAVVAAANAASAAGCSVIVDPAPARPLPGGLPTGVILTPNEDELRVIAGRDGDPEDVAMSLTRDGGIVVATLGAAGALVCTQDRCEHVEAPRAERVVDTTGAGDTLTGVLAAELAGGAALLDAVKHAVAAATMSTATAGARGGTPRRNEAGRRVRRR